MAQHNLSNRWIAFKYETHGRTHTQKISVSSSATTQAPANVIMLHDRTGFDDMTLQQFATWWTGYIAPFYVPTTYAPITMDLYYQPDGALEPLWLSGTTTGLATGTAGGANTQAVQVTMTFKDTQGKPFKVVLLEPNIVPFAREPYVTAPTRAKNLMDAVGELVSPILSRANNPIGQKMNYTVTYNDRLTQKVYKVR